MIEAAATRPSEQTNCLSSSRYQKGRTDLSDDNPTGFAPDVQIPWPRVSQSSRLIDDIVASREYLEAAERFSSHEFWRQSVVGFVGLSLLYAMLRNLRPEYVLEIGSF